MLFFRCASATYQLQRTIRARFYLLPVPRSQDSMLTAQKCAAYSMCCMMTSGRAVESSMNYAARSLRGPGDYIYSNNPICEVFLPLPFLMTEYTINKYYNYHTRLSTTGRSPRVTCQILLPSISVSEKATAAVSGLENATRSHHLSPSNAKMAVAAAQSRTTITCTSWCSKAPFVTRPPRRSRFHNAMS